jgi:hypothetical protein
MEGAMGIEGAKGISIFSSIGGFERRWDDEGEIILPVAIISLSGGVILPCSLKLLLSLKIEEYLSPPKNKFRVSLPSSSSKRDFAPMFFELLNS